jgi:hypothetical protein
VSYRNRFECKFVVPESIATAVFRRVQPFVAVDPYGAHRPDHSYPVASLYLDSPSQRLYHETVDGLSERFKLRVRTYDDDPNSPLFLEVKRRHDRVVQKLRCPIPRHLLPAVLAGEPVELPGNSATKQRSLAEFQRLMLLAQAVPQATVKYQRQAYVGLDDPEVRCTADRRLCALPEPEPRLRMHDPDYRTVPTHGVILELKFTDRMPPWMVDAIRAHDLQRRSFSKYCTSVDALNDRPTGVRLQN